MKADAPVEHLDVAIVGAGISGIGAAYHLQRNQPQRTFAILEARDGLGGTWDQFRFPGVRSDSDLHTLGYEFRPWRDRRAIATGDRILAYLRETAAEYGIERRIRFRSKVVAASWSSDDARWTLEIEDATSGQRTLLTCTWLFCAAGYYRLDEGYTPHFEGRERFGGPILHPQHWPEDLDVSGRRVVVIGSGSTAVTLVPALAQTAAHVVLLQRTPTYILPVPTRDRVANALRAVLGEERAYPLIRRRSIAQQKAVWSLCRRYPRASRRLIRRVTRKHLTAGYPVDVHFNPPYDPWTQRLCIAPDGDLFRAIRDGAVSLVTDRITTFTETGVRLASGGSLDADVIVTATGLAVQLMGGITLVVDGRPVDLAETIAYKGMMLSGVPNLAFAVGYTNSSWTLKVGLLCEHFCRLLAHMDATGYDVAVPVPSDPGMPTRPFLDFGAGYIQRVIHQLPRQGDRAPWLTSMSYQADVKLLRRLPVDDPELRLSRRGLDLGPDAEGSGRATVETGR